jgi:hypothetical protein
MNSHQTSSGRLGEMNPVKIYILKALNSIHGLIEKSCYIITIAQMTLFNAPC